MSFSPEDHEFMQRALALAEGGRGAVEPNPLVGCVIVREGGVIGEGRHLQFGGPHAEVLALRAAGKAARGATMYVTLEPCDHEGKTPACAPAVAAAGIRRVVAATLDPTSTEASGGVRILRAEGVEVDVGPCREEAVCLNAGFFKLAATGRPLVIAKWAMSADGRIATRTGDSQWISSEEARRAVHGLRGRVDAVIVGGRTALQDDPLLTCRDAEARRTVARVVVCGTECPAVDSRLVQTAREAPVLLAHDPQRPPEGLAELADAGCELLPVAGERDDGRVDAGALLDALGARRMTNVLVEGGGELLGDLFDSGLVDRAIVFIAPRIIGGADAVAPVRGLGAASVRDGFVLTDVSRGQVGTDVLIEGWVADPMQWAPPVL